MRVLLDTNAFIWMHSDPDRLGVHRELLERRDTVRLASAVVVWEIVIKHGLGRLDLPAPPAKWIPDKVAAGAMTPVAIELSHSLGVAALPLHHRDPLDRLLISQARAIGAHLLTADTAVSAYDVPVLLIE